MPLEPDSFPTPPPGSPEATGNNAPVAETAADISPAQIPPADMPPADSSENPDSPDVTSGPDSQLTIPAIAQSSAPPAAPAFTPTPVRPSSTAPQNNAPARNPAAGAIVAVMLVGVACAGALLMDRSPATAPPAIPSAPVSPTASPKSAPTKTVKPFTGFVLPGSESYGNPKSAAPPAIDPNALAQLPANPASKGLPAGGVPAAANPAEAAFNAAVTAQKSGNAPAAIAGYLQALKLNPKLLPARTNLAMLYLGSNRAAEGLAQLRTARKIDPKNPAVPFQIAQVLLQLQQPKEALEPLRAAVRLAPKNPGGHAMLAQLYQAQGKPQDALREWKSVMALAPKDANAPFSAGVLELQQRHAAAAEPFFKRAMANEPRDPRAPMMLARAQAAAGNMGQAEHTAVTATQKFPQMVDMWMLLAQVRHDRKNLGGSATALTSAIHALPAPTAKSPAAAQLWVQLGQTQLQMKRPKDALVSMTHATEVAPKVPDVWALRAGVRQAGGDARGAIADFDHALKLDPNRLGDRRVLARLLAAAAQMGRARTEFAAYAKAQPKDPRPLMEWAGAEEEAKQYLAASKLWDRAGLLLPHNPLPAIQSGRLLHLAGNDTAAGARYRAALKMFPKDPNALLGMAGVEEKTGETTQALAHWTQLVTTQPQFPPGIEGLLRTGQKLKQDDDVAKTLKPLLTRHEDNFILARGFLNASQRAGQGAAARDYVKTAWEKRKSPALRRAMDEYDLARGKEKLKELESRPTPTPRPIEEPKADVPAAPADAAPKPAPAVPAGP